MKEEGKIINIISNIFYVEVNKKIYECTSRGIFKNSEIKPVVGDNVIIEIEENTGNIIEVLDRINYIKRPKMANLDGLILVVSSKNPKPDLLMLDKQIAFAEFLNIKPIILINKIDLDNKDIAEEIEKLYSKIGYKVVKTSAKEGINIKELSDILKGKVSAFSGNSGVGKSSLINSMFNENKTLEGEISQKNKKGKNTTTSIKLYEVEENTYIADTPGFSNFEVYEIPYKELYKYFIEFNEFVIDCEYADCTHIKEEMCGIKKEVGNKISISRYENFKKIYEELKDKEEHKW